MKYLKTYERESDLALIAYAKMNDFDRVIKLIKSGVNINIRDDDGNTALIWAAFRKSCGILKELIAAGADLDAKDKYGNTALIYAAFTSSTNILVELIEAGADWNITNNEEDDFLSQLNRINRIGVINQFPEEYKNYLMKKDAEKYNI